jgi:class 3 adenylate cyclase/tetratricopeptide (TPR) repeat protein
MSDPLVSHFGLALVILSVVFFGVLCAVLNTKPFYHLRAIRLPKRLAQQERRLAAIVFTDIVGYAAITQANEAVALALLQEHARILRPIFANHSGREVKMIGDSFLVEFSSALNAVLCAVEIQRELYEHNVANPNSKIELRIGIHVGDVVSEGTDMFGDAVNIASRIEPLANPGSICISQQVYDQVWNKLQYSLVGFGRHELKNIHLPMEVYKVILPWQNESISGEARKVLPLVDRIEELGNLRAALERTIQGKGDLIFIAGEAGVGKTRIADELSALAREKHATVLYGRCSRREGKIPYAPWIEQIREYVRTNPPQMLFKVVGNFGGEVAKLVPDVTAALGPVTAASSGSVDQDRLRFIDAITQLAVNASKETPLVMIMDDANWADSGSLDLLLAAARQVANQRLLLLGIYRDVEVEEDSDLFEFLYDVRREKLGETLQLKGFGPDDTGLLIGEILNQKEVDVEFRDLIFRKTAGNPFFIEELVRSLVEQGVLFRTAKGWDRKPVSEIEIPSGIRTVIKQRLSNLDEESRSVLSVASVTSAESKEFSFALLKAVTEMDESQLIDVIERILKTRLIRETRMLSGRPGFTFTDSRIRDAIYEEMTIIRRSRYHLKAAHGIEEIYRDRLDDIYGVLVFHYLRGNDQAKAAQYALKAADRASSVYAHGEAIRYLNIALEAQEDSPDKAAKSTILQKLGESERYAGRSEYQKHLSEAAKLAAEVGETQRAARIYSNLGFWVFDDNREDHTVPNEYFESAKRLLVGKEETEDAAQLYNNVARFYFLMGRLKESNDLAGKALVLAEKLGLPEVQAHALLTLAILAPSSEKEAKLANMQKALKIGYEHDYYDVIIRASNNLQVDVEDPKTGIRIARDAVAYFKKVGYSPYVDWANLILAGASFATGELEQTTSIAKDFLSRSILNPSFRRESTADLGEVALWQGRFDDAEQYLREYQRLLEGSKDFQEFLRLYLDLGLLYLERDELAKGKEWLEKMIALAKEKGLDQTVTYTPYLSWGISAVVDALLKLGDTGRAESYAQQQWEIAVREKGDAVQAFNAAIQGKLLASRKKYGEAQVSYEKATRLLRGGVYLFNLAGTLRELGEVSLRNGDEVGSKKAFAEAAEIYTRMGAKTYLEKVAQAASSKS